jgi:hypothetical protein
VHDDASSSLARFDVVHLRRRWLLILAPPALMLPVLVLGLLGQALAPPPLAGLGLLVAFAVGVLIGRADPRAPVRVELGIGDDALVLDGRLPPTRRGGFAFGSPTTRRATRRRAR